MKKIFKLPFVPVFFAPLVLFLPILFGGKALFWGTPALQFIPWRDWAWETLQAGQLPVWNPLVGMGAPLFANYQSALLYPPNWLTFIFHVAGDTPAMAWSHTLVVVAHLIWAGWGMAVLMKHLGQNKMAQAVSGLCYSLSGYLVARAGFFSINAASAWLPWMLFLALELVDNTSVTNFLKLTAVITLQLYAGHAQTAFYSLLLTGVWILYWAWREMKKRKVRQQIVNALSVGGIYICSGILAAAIAAVQLGPTLEYLLQSQRAFAVEYEIAMTYSFWPWRLLTLLVPNLFGNPAWGNYWGYANFWEDAIYIGLLPFLIAINFLIRSIAGIFRSDGDEVKNSNSVKRGITLFLGCVILVSFILALGKNTFVFPWLYKNIPTFDLFQAPTRFTIWAVIGLSVLAGFGIDVWQRPKGLALYWTRLATAGAVAVGIGAGLAWLILEGIKPTFILPTALAGMWGAGTGVLALLAPEGRHSPAYRSRWKWAVVLWVTMDLLVAGWGLNPGIDADFYQVDNHQDDGAGRFYLPLQTEYDLKFNEYFVFDSFDPDKEWHSLKQASLPNINMLKGKAMVNNFDPMLPGRYQTWMEKLKDAEPKAKRDLFLLMEVDGVGVHQGQGYVEFQDHPIQPSFARWVSCSRVYSSPSRILNEMMAGGIDHKRTVILERQPGEVSDCAEGGKGDVRLIRREPSASSFSVDSSHSGWVVRSTVWYPGWNAYLDGEQVPVYRGNYLFQAVPVPDGTHELQFRYQPLSLRWGAIVSLAGVLIALILGSTRKNICSGDNRSK